MIRILCVSSSIVDSCSFYRGWGPITALCNKFEGFEVKHVAEVNWAVFRQFDVVYVQRPSTQSYVKIIELAKLNQKKIWIDYDDNLFSVPVDNPSHGAMDKKEVKECIIQSLRMADLVTVSTEALKRVLSFHNNNVHVIPNGYDKSLFSYAENKPHRQKTILWRGSSTHANDLMEVTPQIVNVAKAYPDYSWAFIGEPFWYTVQEIKKVTNAVCIKTQDPIYYFKTIYDLAPTVQIAPLSDNEFNRAKSNIAWIEGTHAGAVVVAPDFPEWDMPGVNNYDHSLQYTLENVLKCQSKVNASDLDCAKRYIDEYLLLDIINKKRVELIKSIL